MDKADRRRRRWIDLIQKYSAIDELTAPLLNELIEKIDVHQSRKDENGKKLWGMCRLWQFLDSDDFILIDESMVYIQL